MEGWIRGNPTISFLDPRRLSLDLTHIESQQLAEALRILVRNDYLRVVYRVIGPSTGTMVGPEFESPDEIPEYMPDRFGKKFGTDEAEIVAILREAD